MLRRSFVCLVVALIAADPAGAGTIVVKLALAPGKLRLTAKPAAISRGGKQAVAVQVADGRGNGKGWTLRLVRTAGLTVTSITARCAARSTCTLPRAVTPAKGAVLRAAPGTGMGVVELVVTVRAAKSATAAFAVS